MENLQTVFGNILDVLAAETDNMAIVEETVVPRKLIQEIADELEKQACEKNIRVIFEVKSTNDKLSDHQKYWLNLLYDCGLEVEVLHII